MSPRAANDDAPVLALDDGLVAKPICHRVKNDLQMLMNLLVLAEAWVDSPQGLSEAVQKRLAALGAAYTLIADQGLHPTAQALAREVTRRVCARHGFALDLEAGGQPVPLCLRLCSPFSLWLGEIIDNAVCHGRPKDGRPRLSFGSGADDHEVWVALADAGGGLPPGFSLEHSAGLGLRLAQAVAQRDLGGYMTLVSGPGGLTVKLSIPAGEFARLSLEPWR